MGVRAFDAYVHVMQLWADLLPYASPRLVNALSFDVYLPDRVLGEDADFYVSSLMGGDQIILGQDRKTRRGGVTETVRVQVQEQPLQRDAHGECLRGTGDPRLCRIWVTTPRGRVVFEPWVGSYPTNLLFAIEGTAIRVSVGRHLSSEPGAWAPVPLSADEVAALVDAFERVAPSSLYGMRVRTGQDV